MMKLLGQLALGVRGVKQAKRAMGSTFYVRCGVAALGLFVLSDRPRLEAAPPAATIPNGAPRLIRLVGGAELSYNRACAEIASAYAADKVGEPFSMRQMAWLLHGHGPVTKPAQLALVFEEYSNGRSETLFYSAPGGLTAYFALSGRKESAFVIRPWAGLGVLEFALRRGSRSPAAKSLIRALQQCTNGNIPPWFSDARRLPPPSASMSVSIVQHPGHPRVFSYYPLLEFGLVRASIRPCRVIWFFRRARVCAQYGFGRLWPKSGIPPLRSFKLWTLGGVGAIKGAVVKLTSIGFGRLAVPTSVHLDAHGLKKLGFAVTKVRPGAKFTRGKAIRPKDPAAISKMIGEFARWAGIGPVNYEPPPVEALLRRGAVAEHASRSARAIKSGGGAKRPEPIASMGNGSAAMAYLTPAKLRIVREDAEKGKSWAMVDMGMYYFLGRGVPRDYAKAMKWYRRGVAAGSGKAMFNIGALYAKGQGVPQDYTKAMEWYRKGAAAGSRRAMCNIGALYAEGQVVPQDYTKAMEWYRKGAAAGSGRAMCNIGSLYAYGQGVPQNYTKAMEWYRKGAAAGSGQAMCNIG